MKTTILALSMIFSSSIAMAMPSHQLDIDVTPINDGAWVKLTQAGEPIVGASINNQFVTNDRGRVFVSVDSQRPKSVKFTAITLDGETVSTKAFISHQ
ncbi:hypothetical protein A1OO_19985 [Enterovibrio norvegicus FF-33]|uniref:hypothetical protein n=1 Tax=Enterovibrio TaxID=188143 RepID=UPI0003010DDB|nr:hypothetical protein [Enterovibrio norvegicus]OEE68016.1 hypothetical protein A1OO_19985 [Enterovibrio norvegicus FF-33]